MMSQLQKFRRRIVEIAATPLVMMGRKVMKIINLGAEKEWQIYERQQQQWWSWCEQNCGDQQGDEEEESVQSGQPALIEGIVLKKPRVPHDYIKVDYLKRGMTEKAKREREKNPLHVRKGRSIDNRFQTKFHQDFYESAILSKKYKVARSQYVD